MTNSTDQNEETRAFLSFLLDHEDGCMKENCPVCQTAQSIYAMIRSRSLEPKWPFTYPWDKPTTIQ